jgi:hypothetical protein
VKEKMEANRNKDEENTWKVWRRGMRRRMEKKCERKL